MNRMEERKGLGTDVEEGLDRVMGDKGLDQMMLDTFLDSVEENAIVPEDFGAVSASDKM